MKRNLAIFRAGDRSLHPQCVAGGADFDWDFALSCYSDSPPGTDGAVFVDVAKEPKWQGLASTLRRHWDVVRRYERIWLPDDDLLVSSAGVQEAFAVCADLGLDLAQPALTEDSYWSHPITLRHAAFQVRFTNFVEVMAPIVTPSLLERLLPTFAGSLSGWGLDSIWPSMTGLAKVGIIDCAPMKHTRPVGGGNGYDQNKAVGLTPHQELALTLVGRFQERSFTENMNLGGLLQTGDFVALGHEPAGYERMLQALTDSVAALPLSSSQRIRYLARHAAFGEGSALSPALVRQAVTATISGHLEALGFQGALAV